MDISKFIASLQEQYRPRAHKACQIAITKFALHVLGEAQELAPIATGFLKASGFMAPPQGDGVHTTIEIGFNASYALFVHENLAAFHSQGQAKFLETAMVANHGNLGAYVLSELQAEFGGGGA